MTRDAADELWDFLSGLKPGRYQVTDKGLIRKGPPVGCDTPKKKRPKKPTVKQPKR